MHSPAIPPDVHAAIERLTFDYARSIDDRDWAAFRRVLTDVCDVDFRSWSGAPPSTMDSDVWVQAVRSVTGAFDATQHLMANLRLDVDPAGDAVGDGLEPDRVVGTVEVQAQHWFDADSMVGFHRAAEPAWCTLGGVFTIRYVRTTDGWRIAACRFTLRWRTGDETLFALVRQRR